jgi:DNA-binding MarR family transcriptional regulator
MTNRRPPDPADTKACTCAALRRAARRVTQAFDAALRPAGLTATQFTVLETLHHMGPLSMTRLADLLAMDRTSLTRTLKPLERDGRIAVRPGADRRVRTAALLDDGRAVLADARPLWAEAQADAVRRVGDRPWAGLVTTLDRLTDPPG